MPVHLLALVFCVLLCGGLLAAIAALAWPEWKRAGCCDAAWPLGLGAFVAGCGPVALAALTLVQQLSEWAA
jgi:hypothetical protein